MNATSPSLLGGPFGPSLGRLEALLSRFGSLVGRLWRPGAVLGVLSGPLGDLLWPSWGCLGNLFGPSRAPLGPPSWAVLRPSWGPLV
eukprot:8725806-Pyramimonas_sp.AAC.1